MDTVLFGAFPISIKSHFLQYIEDKIGRGKFHTSSFSTNSLIQQNDTELFGSSIIKLPEILWRQIFKYLTIGDYKNILFICRSLRTFAEGFTELFERECLRLFTSDLSLFELEHPMTDPIIVHSLKPLRWKKIIMKGGVLTQEWKSLKPVEGLKDATFSPIFSSLLASLRDPSLPTPELCRDEFDAYKKTIFQEHLYEFIFKEGQSGSTTNSSLLLGEIPLLAPSSKSEELDFLQELGQMGWSLAGQFSTTKEKEEFLNLRWYRFPQEREDQISLFKNDFNIFLSIPSLDDKTSYLFSDSLLDDKENTPLILSLLKLVLKTISFFCKVCRAVIDRESSSSEFLCEYCKRWSGYCASMIEIEAKMEPFCKLINDCYELLFPQYPQFPKFSLTRAMVIMWKFKVFKSLAPRLFDSFTQCVDAERAEGLKEASGVLEENKDPEFCFPEASVGLLSNFVHNVADLSLNELTIHHLGSTKFELEGPYSEIHKQFLRHTKRFLKMRAKELHPRDFCTMISNDSRKIKEIFLPATQKEAQRIGRKYTEKCLRLYISSKLKQFDPANYSSESAILPESHLGRFLKENCETPEIAQQFYCSFHCSEEGICRMYEQALSNREDPENISDTEIDYINKKRNIPLELSEEERVLYSFSKEVTPDVLESIYEKFAKFNTESAEELQEYQTEEDFSDFGELPLLSRS